MQAAIVLVLALAAVASANPGLIATPVVAHAPVAYAAPIAPVVHTAAVPVATSHSYKVRAPAAKILAAPALVAPAVHAPVLLH